MSATYLITSAPDSPKIKAAYQQLKTDIQQNKKIKQLFFYSDGVIIGSLERFTGVIEDLLELAEMQQIPLYICSAGFKKRQLSLSQIASEDFTFKGLGQFIAESQAVKHLRIF